MVKEEPADLEQAHSPGETGAEEYCWGIHNVVLEVWVLGV